MALKILNAKRKSGEYQGNKYDNIVIVALDDNSGNRQLLFGPDVETLKFKADAFAECLGRVKGADKTIKDISGLEGRYILPVYDKWGNCIDFSLIDPDTVSLS